MTKTKWMAAALVAGLGAGGAYAQQMGGPAPGTVDSKQVVNTNRETQADYNRTVGAKSRTGAEQKRTSKVETAVAAKPEEVTAGSQVTDSRGVSIGTIETVEADGAVVVTGSSKVKVPLEAFGKNSDGLLLGITKAEFDALVAGTAAGPAS